MPNRNNQLIQDKISGFIKLLTEMLLGINLSLMKKLLIYILISISLLACEAGQNPKLKELSRLLAQAQENSDSNSNQAVDAASRALLLAQDLKLPASVARARLILARAYHKAGVYDKALQRTQQALKGFEQSKDQLGIADCYEQMGNIYWKLRARDQVGKYYQMCLDIRRKYGKPDQIADALNNIGIYNLHHQNKPDAALRYYQEALRISQKAGYQAGIAHSYNSIGNFYLMQGDYPKSLEYNQKSLSLYQAQGDRNRVVINTLIVGYLYQLLGAEAKAESIYFEVIRMAAEIPSPSVTKDAYLNLSELYGLQGKDILHLEYYKRYADLADSIMSAETNRNIANLQTQHEVEKQELENQVLRLDLERQRLIMLSAVITILLILSGLFFIIREKRKSEKLLLNILPRKVANELKRNGTSQPQTFEGVSVLFSDFVNFTRISSTMSPGDLISELSQFFTEFDQAVEQYGCERIKTIGDAYLAVCGLPQAHSDHAVRLLQVAKAMLEAVNRHNLRSEQHWEIRIGLHCGTVVGGIVGTKKYIYDVFGDAINTASRMESNSHPMRINVSEDFYRQVQDQESWEARPDAEVKGKGTMKMYFLS